MGELSYIKDAEAKWDGKSQLIWVNPCLDWCNHEDMKHNCEDCPVFKAKNNIKSIRPLRSHDLSLTGKLERFLTPRDIADRFDVTPAGVLGWISRGWLKARKVGVNWRVSENDLMDFIDRSTNRELS